MNFHTELINGLTCHVVDDLAPGTTPRTVVVLCHGYGAPGTDLVPIGELLLQKAKLAHSVQFLFPEAPSSLEELGMPDGRAWWAIDMWRLQMASATGKFRELCHDCPPELPGVRKQVQGLIQQWSDRTGTSLDRFVLGGFSQGAMLATDVALHLDQNVAGLAILSGTLINEAAWREQLPHHKTLRVFQSHGTDDPILPFVAAGWLQELLNHGGADVEFVSFPGGHGIPLEAQTRLGAFIRDANGDGRTAM